MAHGSTLLVAVQIIRCKSGSTGEVHSMGVFGEAPIWSGPRRNSSSLFFTPRRLVAARACCGRERQSGVGQAGFPCMARRFAL